MRPTSRRLLIAAATLAVAALVIVAIQQPGPSDQEQIAAQIDALRSAAENKSASGVMQEVSSEYHDAVVSNPEQLRFLLSRHVFTGDAPVRVQASNSTISVTGDTATSITNVQVDAGDTHPFSGNITLHWQREPSRRLLFLPDHVWRVVSADYPSDLLGGQ